MAVPDGLKDALAREGRNMQHGAQDAYDRFLGVQPAGHHETHLGADYWPDSDGPVFGPDEIEGYTPPAYEPPGLDTEPLGPDPADDLDVGMER